MQGGAAENSPAFLKMSVKRFREFSDIRQREVWPLEFDLAGVDRDQQIRKQLHTQQQFQTEETMSRAQSTNFFVGEKSVDINRPPREAYRYQEYPKMLYHQTKKDPNWLAEFKRITLHNSLHPEKPEILPVVPAAFVTVHNKQEEETKLGQGFGLKPPPAPTDEEPFANLEGQVLCSRGCGNAPHRGACKQVTLSA